MPKKKSSFFEKLTGTINPEEDHVRDDSVTMQDDASPSDSDAVWQDDPETTAELTVDVYQTPDDIVVETIVAGVDPSELDVTITRDMVTISGHRGRGEIITDNDFFHQELYWGAFSRTILLPEEVDVEEAHATERNGLLSIRLPKIDKKKKTKLEVRTQ